jgi:hypothetical protein
MLGVLYYILLFCYIVKCNVTFSFICSFKNDLYFLFRTCLCSRIDSNPLSFAWLPLIGMSDYSWDQCLFSALQKMAEFCRNMGSEKTTNFLCQPINLIYNVFNKAIRCKYKCNIEARSSNNCHSGKSVVITYSEGVCVALVIQHLMRMHHIVVCGLLRFTIFSTISQKGTIF